jgi:sterol desaturase/sphingolipid hydroxylase (fatty acid hydroxylase superfamily)
LHQKGHSHLLEHHKIFLKQYENSDVSYKEIVSKPGYVLASSLIALILTISLYFVYGISIISLYISALVYLVWVEYVHYLFHSPKGVWLEKIAMFKRIKEHHHIHHTDFIYNYGIGSTFTDYFFFTKKHK